MDWFLRLGLFATVFSIPELYCPRSPLGQTICEFELIIKQRETYTGLINDRVYPMRPKNGGYEFRPNTFYFNTDLAYIQSGLPMGSDITPNVTNFIYADGSPDKILLTINDHFVGPTLVIPDGAFVAVKVTNKMITQGTIVHWHGQSMKGAWVYDGSPTTQCPILPGQTFTYRFRAEAGSHMYHSHLKGQKRDGLFGSVIVYSTETPYPVKPLLISEVGDPEMSYDGTGHTTNSVYINNGSGSSSYHGAKRIYTASHQEIGAGYWKTTLINGKGRNEDIDGNLNKFEVVSPGYFFAINHLGNDGFYQVTVDNHFIEVHELDGKPIKKQNNVFDSVMLAPGERITVKFISRVENPINSYIRFNTLAEFFTNSTEYIDRKVQDPDIALGATDYYSKLVPMTDGEKQEISGTAILSYTDSEFDMTPNFSRNQEHCSIDNPCKILNCMQQTYPGYVTCVSISELENIDDTKNFELDEKIYEFHTGFAIGPHFNGFKTRYPSVPISLPTTDYQKCSTPAASLTTACAYMVSLPYRKRVRMLISNADISAMHDTTHPIHLHGNHFRILYQGYPVLDDIGQAVSPHPALFTRKKLGNAVVQIGLNLTDLILNENGPLKDVIAIPAGGFALVELETGNAGIWNFHCHIQQHIDEGMAMLLKIGNEFPAVPEGFPTCEIQTKVDLSVDGFEKLLSDTEKWPQDEITTDSKSNFLTVTWFILIVIFI